MDLSHLAWIEREPGGRAWLDELPELVRSVAADWSLTLGPPFLEAHVSFTAAVVQDQRTDAVLKIQFPHRECEYEAEADVLYRLDCLCADLDLDRDRARGWTIAQTVAWTSDSTQPEWCDQLVRWLLAA